MHRGWLFGGYDGLVTKAYHQASLFIYLIHEVIS
jgi:hypothetical protein